MVWTVTMIGSPPDYYRFLLAAYSSEADARAHAAEYRRRFPRRAVELEPVELADHFDPAAVTEYPGGD